MFSDKRFVTKVSVDKRGRPKSFASKENFEKFYDLESSSDDDEAGPEEAEVEREDQEAEKSKATKNKKKQSPKETGKKVTKKVAKKSEGNSSVGKLGKDKHAKDKKSRKVVDSESSSESDVESQIRAKLRSDEVDYARGEANLLSDSRCQSCDFEIYTYNAGIAVG
jgi:hypothetical protein